MPGLNWNAFMALPGSQSDNFELLCRGIIRTRFGRFGTFKARANQPGVEFHLSIDSTCSLGEPGRRWGWQCRWYSIPSGTPLSAKRKDKIVKAIRTTEKHVPDLTDWVLWTRHQLTAADQDWFYEIDTDMRLELWAGDEVDTSLTGEAEVFRSTFFGELVVTPHVLCERHSESTASISHRWLKRVHEELNAEARIRRMLGGPASWPHISALAAEIRQDAEVVAASPAAPRALQEVVDHTLACCNEAAAFLEDLANSISTGDLDALDVGLGQPVPVVPRELHVGLRRLRAGRQPSSLGVTNAVESLSRVPHLVGEIRQEHRIRLVAVVAEAGCGKTQLAASISAPSDHRPAGILLHGGRIPTTGTLNDLAQDFMIAAKPVASMDALVAALDAAGQRAKRRLPLVIDGLNESEDPRIWKEQLATLEHKLERYPYVLAVCTIRPHFSAASIPDGVETLAMPGFDGKVRAAVRRYFEYFKIDSADQTLPLDVLRHPLTLRTFCQVTNPSRKDWVGIESMPDSLCALFDRYIDQAADRIARLSPSAHRYVPLDVKGGLSRIGRELWDRRARQLPRADLIELLGDRGKPWDRTLLHALEAEGVLYKVRDAPSGPLYAPAYDPLAGHLIARGIIGGHTPTSLKKWLGAAETGNALGADVDTRHPLAADIVASLVGLIPIACPGHQLWSLVQDEELAEAALYLAASLGGTSLDASTVAALERLTRAGPTRRRDLFQQIARTRGLPSHPLNSLFLDRCLRPLGVVERDLLWSEWIRRNHEGVVTDLERLEARIQRVPEAAAECLGRWVMWMLTSNVPRVRDLASRVLYRLGRVRPKVLFDLCVSALTVNDDYVVERMAAVGYGACLAHRHQEGRFTVVLRGYLGALSQALVGQHAKAPTWHWLARMYVQDTFRFAARFFPEALPKGTSSPAVLADAPAIPRLAEGAAEGKLADRALDFDFHAYKPENTVPWPDRGLLTHSDQAGALDAARGVVWALGWRHELFDSIDGRIIDHRYRRYSFGAPAEPYSEKYCWSGFYRYAGWLAAQGKHASGDRLSYVGIDPCFPSLPPRDPDPWPTCDWLGAGTADPEDWLRGSTVSFPPTLIRRHAIGEAPGPWLAVHGWIEVDDRVLGRRAVHSLDAVICENGDGATLAEALAAGTQRPWGTGALPRDVYTCAGEIPWSRRFSGRNNGPYEDSIWLADRTQLDVETLAHVYGWEGQTGEVNDAAGTVFPSGKFSRQLDLRGHADTFNQSSPDGRIATISVRLPDGMDGQILYLREDLLLEYADDRSVVWNVLVERFSTRHSTGSPPDWLRAVWKDEAYRQRLVYTSTDLKPA